MEFLPVITQCKICKPKTFLGYFLHFIQLIRTASIRAYNGCILPRHLDVVQVMYSNFITYHFIIVPYWQFLHQT
jgi:hypothetical protein